MKPLNLKPRSGGFTLIELLVVIAIVGILGALAAGAVFRVRGSQDQKTTEVAVTKLGSALDMQIKASMDMVRETPTPPSLLVAAGSDPARAKAIMNKIRIRGDFPQTVPEANSVGGVGYAGYTVPGSQTYIKKLANYTGGGSANEESAICLHMILTQARRGVMFNPEEAMGAGGIGQVRGMPVFMDKFGSPIGFRRWANSAVPVEATILNEVEGNKDLTPDATRKDPYDPEGRLNGWTDTNTPSLVTVLGGNFQNNRNYLPFVYAMGKDKVFNGSDSDDIFSFRLRKSGQKGN